RARTAALIERSREQAKRLRQDDGGNQAASDRTARGGRDSSTSRSHTSDEFRPSRRGSAQSNTTGGARRTPDTAGHTERSSRNSTSGYSRRGEYETTRSDESPRGGRGRRSREAAWPDDSQN